MPIILYERQRQILDYICQYIQRHGSAPSLKDIAQGMGLSSLATVHEHLSQLQRKGVIRISGIGKQRKLEIVDKKLANPNIGVQLPILGYFVEGGQIEPYMVSQAFFGVPPSLLVTKHRGFLLQVKDNSLLEEGICQDDLLVMEEKFTDIKAGQVVVCFIAENIAVMRRFYQEATRIKLMPIRSLKKPLFCNKVKIQGIVSGVIRRY